MGTDIETYSYGAVCVNMERIYKYMEENVIVNDEKLDAIKDSFTPPGAKTKTDSKVDGKDGKETSVTFTEDEVAKKIQSAEDKLRRKYSDEIKDLQEQIKKLSPVEKSESEIAIENRLAELEKAQEEVNAQKAFLSLQDTLQSKGIQKSLATFLKADVDVDAFVTAFNASMKEVTKDAGYVPDSHNAGDKITAEDWGKMKYSEKVEIMNKSPELYKRLMAKFKK